MFNPADLTRVRPTVASRAVTFENTTGAPGAGGSAASARKGAPMRVLAPGERVVLADIEGPGTIRHIWLTFPPAPPEIMRAKIIEVFYDGASEPSISVPAVDFFGVPWGRPVSLNSALAAINEGRGFNSFIPMPFPRSVRVEFVNGAPRPAPLYFQIDYTIEPDLPEDVGYLHATFRRQNPTTKKHDFVIAGGLRGPGRFLGCVVGVRVLDGGLWYGEGEVKVYLDGDRELPTICGTGLEDYVGSAWGMGPHQALYMGAPLEVRPPDRPTGNPDFVGFYRWHVVDPILFAADLTVTIQQIGFELFLEGQEEQLGAREPAGGGWYRSQVPGVKALGIAERSDDYCATAFVMCAEPQAVAQVDIDAAIADIGRLPYEVPAPMEQSMLASLMPTQ